MVLFVSSGSSVVSSFDVDPSGAVSTMLEPSPRIDVLGGWLEDSVVVKLPLLGESLTLVFVHEAKNRQHERRMILCRVRFGMVVSLLKYVYLVVLFAIL